MTDTLQRTLPSEICDQIIDQLRDEDKTALQACSLVCKAWLPRSSKYLFAVLLLSDRRHVRRFLELTQTNEVPRVTRHTTDLRISVDTREIAHSTESLTILASELYQLFTSFLDLRSVDVRDSPSDNVLWGSLYPHPVRIGHLQRMALTGTPLTATLLGYWDHIEELEFRVDNPVLLYDPGTTYSRLPIQCLNFQGRPESLFSLARLLDVSLLRRLELHPWVMRDITRIPLPLINDVLAGVTAHLEHFTFRCPISEGFNVGECRCLT